MCLIFMARNNYLHQPQTTLSFLFGWYLSATLSSQHARNNNLHQPTPPLSFLFGWYLSAPLPSQHGQKQLPVPTHTATLLYLWLVPFCTPPPQPTWPETTTCTKPHCHSPFSLVSTFLHPSPANMPETTTCTNPRRHSPFSLVGTFLHPLPCQHGQKQLPASARNATLLSL